MKALVIAAVLAILAIPARAQSSSEDLSNLVQWVQAQQVNLGTSASVLAKPKVQYALSWWDVANFGLSGINVGRPDALDYVDLGPAMAASIGQVTRYGAAVPVHFGNMWNDASSHLPSVLAGHVYLASLPNVVLAPVFMAPVNRPLNKWRWDNDFQVAVAYRFGPKVGAPGTASAARLKR